MRALLNWTPDECYFAEFNADPPTVKEHVLTKLLFPKYGTDPRRYLAVESNADTHKMYWRYGINGLKVFPHTEVEATPPARPARGPSLF